MADWQDQNPNWKEIICAGCQQRMRGTEVEIKNWIPRHETVTGHLVNPRK